MPDSDCMQSLDCSSYLTSSRPVQYSITFLKRLQQAFSDW